MSTWAKPLIRLSKEEWSDRRQSAVWHVSTEYTSVGLHSISTKEQLDHAARLIAEGYRPASFSVRASNEDSPLVSASVWHRPLIPETERESLAKLRPMRRSRYCNVGIPTRLRP
jgi:hypothetical protein